MFLRGILKCNGLPDSNKTIATLPEGYRPPYITGFACVGLGWWDKVAGIAIQPTGAIECLGSTGSYWDPAGGWMSLNGFFSVV